MIEKIKASKSEKIIFIFIIVLALFFFGSFFLIKDKCLFVKDYNPYKIKFNKPKNIAVLNVPCGNVIIELYPEISPNGVKRFITLVKSKAYDDVAFHRVIKDTLVQAGDLEFGKRGNKHSLDTTITDNHRVTPKLSATKSHKRTQHTQSKQHVHLKKYNHNVAIHSSYFALRRPCRRSPQATASYGLPVVTDQGDPVELHREIRSRSRYR